MRGMGSSARLGWCLVRKPAEGQGEINLWVSADLRLELGAEIVCA
jgi:hypothetical protein